MTPIQSRELLKQTECVRTVECVELYQGTLIHRWQNDLQ